MNSNNNNNITVPSAADTLADYETESFQPSSPIAVDYDCIMNTNWLSASINNNWMDMDDTFFLNETYVAGLDSTNSSMEANHSMMTDTTVFQNDISDISHLRLPAAIISSTPIRQHLDDSNAANVLSPIAAEDEMNLTPAFDSLFLNLSETLSLISPMSDDSDTTSSYQSDDLTRQASAHLDFTALSESLALAYPVEPVTTEDNDESSYAAMVERDNFIRSLLQAQQKTKLNCVRRLF